MASHLSLTALAKRLGEVKVEFRRKSYDADILYPLRPTVFYQKRVWAFKEAVVQNGWPPRKPGRQGGGCVGVDQEGDLYQVKSAYFVQ